MPSNDLKYTLLYHGGVPGRGEFIRLLLEASSTPYTDPANAGDPSPVYASCKPECTGIDGNPPAFSPPMLKVAGAGKDGKDLILTQTSNILLYLSKTLGFNGDDEVDAYYVNALTLTALDLNNEVHDTHHPVGTTLYYEDQKEEALRAAGNFREMRIPKFCSLFERTLKGNEGKGKGKYMVGKSLSYADTTVWQVLNGLKFAFPKEMKAREGDYPLLFGTFYPSVEGEKGIKEYLGSERRLKYGMGIFRDYPELDRQ
ncbi:hypothetical protein BT63DRAFT_429693 [Microthyrium microscopicum]|uniref:Glutathione S-transferase n=1 Tax=Microthyrium microscopicum TaxID=703497 RepID=A0A6A6TXJ0_9PEZI|nr:hypothetical protein BT63DRAFT_429693 [Microthyrium microscopicum]